MKLRVIDPPRVFETGRGAPIAIADCARIELSPDEQVTFVTPAGAEYDVTRKAWGFYATPSLNGRLLNFNLRAALARGPAAKYYVFLVERGHERDFERYLAAEQNTLVRWLDNDDDLRAIETITSVDSGPPLHCPCGGDRFTSMHSYFAPPNGEASLARAYQREIYRCSLCGHYTSTASVAQQSDRGRIEATYGDDAAMRQTFDRIMALPPERSDNVGRVARIDAFAATHLRAGARQILDVGSGPCVFLARMKAAGWQCTALDPDPRAAVHAREVAGVTGISGSLPNDSLGKFDAIAFNNVLEHVADPIALLAAARPHVAEHGFVYVELPDGEAAAREGGFGREEFFVEHLHVFSMGSLARLAERAGFEVRELERLRELSGRFTLRGFLTPRKS